MNSPHPIHFLMTGGTIDSYYDVTKEEFVPREHSGVPAYIKNLKLYNNTEFTEICMKDSRAMDYEDREALSKAISESSAQHIIVTHGTYTMPETARFLQDRLKNSSKIIAMTGSMIPLSIAEFSDGGFSLGFAVAKVQTLEPGVYVCMNGRAFLADEATKVLNEARFTSLFNR